MDEYVCITVLSKPGEDQSAFTGRLSQLWTHLLRTRKADFEKVYAETTEFEESNSRWSRTYLAELGVADVIEEELRAAGIDFEPIDREDLYSKYEAVPPEWMQIEH